MRIYLLIKGHNLKICCSQYVQLSICTVEDESRTAQCEWNALPTGPNNIILGDCNARNGQWDSELADNDSAELEEEFCDRNKMVIVNNGAGTCFNSSSEKFTTPDITIAYHLLAARTDW